LTKAYFKWLIAVFGIAAVVYFSYQKKVGDLAHYTKVCAEMGHTKPVQVIAAANGWHKYFCVDDDNKLVWIDG